MLNRSAVIVRPKQPFLNWLESLGVPDDELPRGKEAVYLAPEYRHPDQVEEVLKSVFQYIFEHELGAWDQDESSWPDTADYALFRQWLDIEQIELVIDAGEELLEDEG